MKKITLFAVAIAIGFAGIAQTAATPKQDGKAPVKTEKKATVKKDSAKAEKKTNVKAADVKAK